MPITRIFKQRQCEVANRGRVCVGGAVHQLLLQPRFHDEHVSSQQHQLSVRRSFHTHSRQSIH